MWWKLLAGTAVALAFGLAAFLCNQVIRAYGDARYAAGGAADLVAQTPAILTANAAAAKIALDARDRQIAADAVHATTTARLLPLILSSNDEVTAYAATDGGRSACLDADRVHRIQTGRAALFPTTAAGSTPSDIAGPVPAGFATDPTGWRPE